MVASMTGYGKGEARLGEGMVNVEIRTVNHRFIDFSIRVPRPLNGYEKEIERIARRVLKRGHVYVTVTLDRSIETGTVAINKQLLRSVYRELTAFAAEEGIPGSVDINTLLSLPEIFSSEVEGPPASTLWVAVRGALEEALRQCVRMRRREGEALLRDIRKRTDALERVVAKIEDRAPQAIERTLAKIRKRLNKMLGDTAIDESRWSIEAAIMADRTDFSEELVRLKSHLQQLKSVIKKGGEISKKLTFLLQEIHREATTMGNKADDSVIIRGCLAVKESVEKVREQAQNLE
ncbi:MAG: YicC family protein [bacterium]|nr:MAG: YicC family protein [bacterium]